LLVVSAFEVVVAEEELLLLLELDEEELEVAELEAAELVLLDLGPTSDLMVKSGVKLTSVVLSSLIWKA